MTTYIYKTDRCLPGCNGNDHVEAGDTLLFPLINQPAIPDFPESIEAEVLSVQDINEGAARKAYEVEYDETLVGGLILDFCNFDGVATCLECCDILSDKFDNLTASDINDFDEAVIAVIDTDGDGDFDADDLKDGIEAIVTNGVANGLIVINATDVNGFCEEVANCISNDTDTQGAITSLVSGAIADGTIGIPESALDSDGDGDFDADDIAGFCAKVGTCIANDPALAESIAEELESRIEIEDLATTAPVGSSYVSDGNGGLTTTTGVYSTLPTTNVGSPIVSDVSGESLVYYWDGASYIEVDGGSGASDVYPTLPASDVGSPIVSDVSGTALTYYWDGATYQRIDTYGAIDNVTAFSDTSAFSGSTGTSPFSVDLTTLGVPSGAKGVYLKLSSVISLSSSGTGAMNISLKNPFGNLTTLATARKTQPDGASETEDVVVYWPISNDTLEGEIWTNQAGLNGGGTITLLGYEL